MRRFSVLLGSLLVMASLLSGCGQQQVGAATGPESLTIRVIPTQSKDKLGKAMDKLAEHLSKELQIPTKIEVLTNYQAVVAAMTNGKGDIAYFGPFTYAVAHEQSGAEAFVTQLVDGKPYYHSLMIVPKDSPLRSLDDVVGGRVKFAFGDAASTSSHIVPRVHLKRAGYDPEKEGKAVFTGGHDKVLAAVANGTVAAGAIDSAIFATLEQKMPAEYGQVRVIWSSPELFQYPWAVSKDLPKELIPRLQAAFKNVTDQEILDAFGASGFTEASDSEYDDVRAYARELGIDIKQGLN